MSPYDPSRHHRRSIRLKGYDYSSPGYYFVTICIQNRAHLLGKIEQDPTTGKAINQLNPSGKMIQKWYQKLEDKFRNIKCHASIIMPNHFHCILEIVPTQEHVPNSSAPPRSSAVRVDPRVYPNPSQTPNKTNDTIPPISLGILAEHKNSPLSTVIQWFKTMSTNEYIRGVKTKNWPRFDQKLWQRNYYEHIIRNEKAYGNITRYINNNPKKWHLDTMNKNYTP